MERDQHDMKADASVKVFASVEGLSDVWTIDASAEESIAGLLKLLAKKYARDDVVDMLVTLEDEAVPLAGSASINTVFKGAKRGRIHVHRCKQVDITIEYNAKSHSKSFSPSATAQSVFRWAVSDKAFNLQSDAHDLELQLPGATNALPLNTQVGTIATKCVLKLDLVPKDRPQG